MAQDPIINIFPPAGTPSWVNGLFILLGAVAGASLTLLSTMLSDRRRVQSELAREQLKIQSEDERRWYEKTRELSAAYIAAVRGAQQSRLGARAAARNLLRRGLDWATSPYLTVTDVGKFFFSVAWHPKLFFNLVQKRRDIDRHSREVTRSFMELRLVAPESIVRAAGKLYEHIRASPHLLSSTDDDWRNWRDEYVSLERELIEVVRAAILLSQSSANVDIVATRR